MNQNTISKEVKIVGKGLHSGKDVTLILKPAPVNNGIQFIFILNKKKVKANFINVISTDRGTNIGDINTVEHLLAALYSLSITNVDIEIDHGEVPALDGSAKQFCSYIISGGIKKQNGNVAQIVPKEPLYICKEDKNIVVLPHNRLEISFMINYPTSFVGSQFYRFIFSKDRFIKEIAPARTYGFLSELEALRSKGLALGATYDNAVVIGSDKYENSIRFPDELVRHKILDLIGDISLTGAEIKAHIICIRSGHNMNIELAKKLSKEVG